jgi:hypothetical protein
MNIGTDYETMHGLFEFSADIIGCLYYGDNPGVAYMTILLLFDKTSGDSLYTILIDQGFTDSSGAHFGKPFIDSSNNFYLYGGSNTYKVSGTTFSGNMRGFVMKKDLADFGSDPYQCMTTLVSGASTFGLQIYTVFE